VLNYAYLEWVSYKDSQGLNGSMISRLKPNWLPISSPDVIEVDGI
jgi:hypothetical protein